MRETLGHRFDVIVVVWALAIVVGWSFVTLGRSESGETQWGETPHGPVWVVVDQPATTVLP